MDQDKIFKIGLWVSLIGFGVLAIIEIFPIIKYLLITVGIVVPSIILYKKYKKEKDE
jgi:hypothetical protein